MHTEETYTTGRRCDWRSLSRTQRNRMKRWSNPFGLDARRDWLPTLVRCFKLISAMFDMSNLGLEETKKSIVLATADQCACVRWCTRGKTCAWISTKVDNFLMIRLGWVGSTLVKQESMRSVKWSDTGRNFDSKWAINWLIKTREKHSNRKRQTFEWN